MAPKESHLSVKMILRYLKGTTDIGLWYPKEVPFDLVCFSDSDYAGHLVDRKVLVVLVSFSVDV